MSIDWSKVKERHVKEACFRYDTGDTSTMRAARNTFLLLDGKRYPAKFIRGLAYEIATGNKVSSGDYSGGAETVRFFRALGFSVEYKKKEVIDEGCEHDQKQKLTVQANNTPVKEDKRLSPKMQRAFLRQLLEQRIGCVEVEAKFDWLEVPDYDSMEGVLKEIYDRLVSFRGYKDFPTPGYKLSCDFFIPSKKIIIEYDERQHFTEQRAKSLSHYPVNLNLGFDINKWREACESIRATDPDPIYRDEQRALYDSVRDIFATRNGMTLIRIKHGDYNWELESGKKTIDYLITPHNAHLYTSNLEEAIEELACDFSSVQKAYREWAKQFDSHEEVITWLEKNRIDTSRCQEQDSFDLFSSHWNSITSSILYNIIPGRMAGMKNRFDRRFQNFSDTEIERAWYLLYFIHPIRHELYYFNLHYPDGYYFRLARLIRSHRQGLKATRTYFSKGEKRTTDGPFITACGTTAFKHIHLHPTTSTWDNSNLQNKNVEKTIQCLEIGKDNLSSDEMNVAMTLGRKARLSFKGWIEYAPCAINEGPIFTLKENKRLSNCFKDVVKILQGTDQNQDIIRAKLEEHYDIEV